MENPEPSGNRWLAAAAAQRFLAESNARSDDPRAPAPVVDDGGSDGFSIEIEIRGLLIDHAFAAPARV